MIWRLNMAAGMPMPKARRSSTPGPRSTSRSGLLAPLVDLQTQVDQARGAVGGEGGHDAPAAVGQDLQALAAQRPPPVPSDINDIGVSQHGVRVAAVGFHARWAQGHSEDQQAG